MSIDTITERPGTCNCAAEVALTESRAFAVAPRDGGGWPAWAAALTRLLVRLSVGPAHCVIITQEPTHRYVQMMLGHGHARVEASGNAYLCGDFRLGASEESALAALGFRHTDALGNDSGQPENWWIDNDVADPIHIAQLVTATLCGVMAFDDRWPVTIELFGADSPCDACFWEVWMDAPDASG